MGTFSWSHLLIIAVLFVLFFGAKRLPDAARGLGRSLRIFKSEVNQMQSESETAKPQQPESAAPQQLPAANVSAQAAEVPLDKKTV